jgi:hypothetical protein
VSVLNVGAPGKGWSARVDAAARWLLSNSVGNLFVLARKVEIVVLRRSLSKGWDLFETTQIYSGSKTCTGFDVSEFSNAQNRIFRAQNKRGNRNSHSKACLCVYNFEIPNLFCVFLSFYCFPNGEYFLS